MTQKITFKGNPLTLVGRNLKLGKKAPNFHVFSPELKEQTLADFNGKNYR